MANRSPIPDLHRRVPDPSPGTSAAGGASAAAEQLAAAHDRAGNLLTDRYADGSVTDDMFEEYLARLRVATDLVAVERVVAELQRLPARPPGAATAPSRGAGLLPPDEQRILAVMSETKRGGAWKLPRVLRVRAVMADLKLDFRHTVIPDGFTVDLQAIMANVTIIVPPHVASAFDVFPFMSSARSDAPDPADAIPGATAVTVQGTAIMAEVKVIIRDRSR